MKVYYLLKQNRFHESINVMVGKTLGEKPGNYHAMDDRIETIEERSSLTLMDVIFFLDFIKVRQRHSRSGIKNPFSVLKIILGKSVDRGCEFPV